MGWLVFAVAPVLTRRWGVVLRAELERFVANLDRGMAADRRYVELNRLALDNICKKFDKRNSKNACVRAASLTLLASPPQFS